MLAPKSAIDEIATEALEKAKGDVIKATAIMAKRVLDNDVLYHRLMDPLVQNACYDVVRGLIRKNRGQIYNMPQPTPERASLGVLSLATGLLATLLDFPLPGGKRLGDATRVEINGHVVFYETQSKDMRIKARWLKLVAGRLRRDDVTVAEVLSDKQLRRLKEEAEHA